MVTSSGISRVSPVASLCASRYKIYTLTEKDVKCPLEGRARCGSNPGIIAKSALKKQCHIKL